jgi:aspartyl-tRNA(Asn)/glutamyl-tRNA(Gln) amidotransferase subunit B
MTDELLPTIGIEVHAELKTHSKMFCGSPNDPEDTTPNAHTCPVCLAHPGTLPVINREAVRHVLRVGTAIEGKLPSYTEFDRKNYFYPDLPKGYQISQYAYPLVAGGSLAGVQITRIHLEEDTARSSHDPKTGATLIDFNRAGVPLMELVTEPVVHSAEEAGNFCRELQRLLRALGVSDANMEAGQMRVEANISVGAKGTLGTKVEVKNLNSFRSMERAIDFEIKRHKDLIKEGKSVVQETRGWDEAKQETFTQRIKEGSADYRYFPDPDLPKLVLTDIPEFSHAALVESLPELPAQKRERLCAMGISVSSANTLLDDRRLGDLFDATTVHVQDKKLLVTAANYLVSDLTNIIRDIQGRGSCYNEISGEDFANLIAMIGSGELSSRGAKDILLVMATEGGVPRVIAEERGLFQKSDIGALEAVARSVIEKFPQVASEYRAGKTGGVQFLVGQAMKETKGSGNPQVLRELLEKELAR